MKVYRLILSENTIPIYVLPIKYVDEGKEQVGFLAYWLNKKSISKDYILNESHGILGLPEVDKDQHDVNTSLINTAEDFIQLFTTNFDAAGLNAKMREIAVDVDFDLSDEDKRHIIEQLDIDEEGKYENTKFLE